MTGVLHRYAADIDRSLKLAGPYFRLVNNATGSGRWIDNYICGLVEDNREPCVPPRISGGAR